MRWPSAISAFLGVKAFSNSLDGGKSTKSKSYGAAIAVVRLLLAAFLQFPVLQESLQTRTLYLSDLLYVLQQSTMETISLIFLNSTRRATSRLPRVETHNGESFRVGLPRVTASCLPSTRHATTSSSYVHLADCMQKISKARDDLNQFTIE